ncbi:MAG: LUD domain-containing protein [Actinomycetaceae bacterium]|nr:LUD domain-containing protein [Actinomycetaceae bacterium]
MQRLRTALAVNPIEAVQVPRNYISSSEHAPGSDPVLEVFVDALEDYKANVQVVEPAQVGEAIASALGDLQRIVVPPALPESWVEALADKEVIVDRREQPLSNHELDQVDAVVTASRCAVSHTGTIMLDGTEDQGRRAITLVPDTHVVVVRAEDVYPTVPQAVAVLGENPTRPTTWIAGPSATSDIELIRVDGVHGPRNLFVVIVKS